VSRSTRNAGYSRSAIFLHWLVALFMVLQFLAAWNLDNHEGPGAAGPISNFHASLGLTIAVLALLRLFNRFVNPVPQLPNIPAWQQRSAEAVHIALLILLIVMPIAGVYAALNEGAEFRIFGVLSLPPLAAPESDLGEMGHELHEIGGTLLLVLIGIHVAAALYHHVIARDDVLKRMLPHRR